MSRGPGAMQREILEAVSRRRSRPVSRGEVQWELAEAIPGRITSGPTAQLTNAFYKSFSRAWGTLREAGDITPVTGPLRTPEGAALHYPHRTRDASLRAMRLRLFPALLDYAARQPPVFKPAELERRARARAEDPGEEQRRRQLWARIETPLITLASEPATRTWALMVVAKGRSLYISNSRIGTGATRDELIRSAPPSIPTGLVAEIRELFHSEYPPDRFAMWRFKDILYRVVRFQQDGDGKPGLKEGAMNALYQHDPAYVSSLPGFKIEDSGFITMSGERILKTRYGDDLASRLVDRHVLEEFEVIPAAE